ncbi:class I SAM-dependent methyltransferase [Leucothrix sargassi]|nr:class I SAM-dependent methyltransferase [Leucothrix sargassi]
MDAAQKMDQQYRYQRYVYDWSRKYYLLGRDTLLRELPIQAGQHVLEIGCGTARNLLKLSKAHPDAHLYGLDASRLMLDLAQEKRQFRQANNITLKQGLAQQMTPALFEVDDGFDHIVFPYVLSMIPNWEEAIEQAIRNLNTGGSLHIVDFSDQSALPRWFSRCLMTWLGWFHVHPDPTLPAYLATLSARLGGELTIKQIAGRYALIVHYTK